MKQILNYSWLMICLFFSTLSMGQEYGFDKLSLEDGLSQISINAITQDSRGVLWFGTQDGLNRFDGYEFTVFKNQPFDSTSLSENFISALLEDSKGRLWVGTRSGGLHLFDEQNGSFTRFLHHPTDSFSISDNNINTIYEDSEQNIWVGTSNGLNQLMTNADKAQFQRFLYEKEFNRGQVSNRFIRSIFQDSKKNYWVGTAKEMLQFQFVSEKGFQKRNTIETEESVFSINEDLKNNIWYGTSKGAFCLHPETKEIIHYNENAEDNFQISGQRVREIKIDRTGNILIGTDKGINIRHFKEGEYVTNFKAWNQLENNRKTTQFSNNIVSVIHEDKVRNDLYWLGTPFSGISKMYRRNKLFETNNLDEVQFNQIINTSVVRHIYQPADGALWLGGDFGLLRHHEADDTYEVIEQINLINRKEPFNLRSINQLYKSKDGVLYGLSRQGLIEFNGEDYHSLSGTLYQSPSEDKSVFCVLEDEDGLYVGTWLGINYFNKQTKEFLHQSYILDEDKSRQFGYRNRVIFQDSDSNLWVGTSNGLILYRNYQGNLFDNAETPEIYYHDENDRTSLCSDDINHITEDNHGNIWIATRNGLIRVTVESDGLSFENYNEQHGLANNMVYGMLVAEDEIWLSSNKGLSRVVGPTGQIDNFDITDGLQSNEFNAQAFFQAEDGRLIFGGIKGYTAFYPQDITLETQIPPVLVTKLETFDNRVINLMAADDKIVRLPYRQNTFSIHYIGLDYLYPNDVTYFYDLEGSDEKNVSLGSSRQVNFSEVPPGKYTFKIRAANKDGAINTEGDTLQLVIIPPFWQTLWFYIIIGSLVALLLWFLFYLNYQYKVRQIEEVERVRKNAAQDFHDELGSKLTIISMFSELTKSKLDGQSEEASPYINKVIDTSNSLYQSMKDLLWALNPEQDTVKDLYFQLKDFGEDLYNQTGVEFQSEGIRESLSETELPMEYKRHILLIFKELMNNALKHSQCTEVTFKMYNQENELMIEFADNGKGFDKDKTFEGDGLKNIFSRANKIEGNLTVNSSEHGSKFLLSCKL